MKIDTLVFTNEWIMKSNEIENKDQANIVFVFGETIIIENSDFFEKIQKIYPNANIVGASSAGNILNEQLKSEEIVATAVCFNKMYTKISIVDFVEKDEIKEISSKLINQLPKENLKHIFILSDGLKINGSFLVEGINDVANGYSVSGGLAGDQDRFEKTLIIANDKPKEKRIVAVGFYGDTAKISAGYFSGWSEFGTDRLVTKSKENVLFEIDGEPALDLYKKYLGEYASDLPASGLRFPLSIKEKEGEPEIIRTLLSINEDEKSITFAGNIPEGYLAILMKPDIDFLIKGAEKAAEKIDIEKDVRGLALVVSCVGRKIVLNQVIDEELEAVADVLGDNVQMTGFYSYGEIAPLADGSNACRLHNQTMTLTVIYEK